MLKRPLPPRECNGGWNALIDALVADLDTLTGTHCVGVAQIKEKFGALRFYLARGSELPSELLQRISERIQLAERVSAATCEECGEPGMIHPWDGIGYYCARCQRHAREIARTNIDHYQGPGWCLDESWRLVDGNGQDLTGEVVRELDLAANRALLDLAEEGRRFESGMATVIEQQVGLRANVRVHLPAEAAHDWRAARFLAKSLG